MGSIMGVRFCANIQLRNCAVVSVLKPVTHTNFLHHYSLNKKMQYPKSQHKSSLSQFIQHCDFFKLSLCNCIKVDNTRKFSITCVILAKNKDRGKDKKKQKLQHIDYNEMEQVVDVNKIISQYEKAIEGLKDNFTKYLSVRSSVGVLEELSVKFEGKDYKLQELAQISRKPKLIVLNVSVFPQVIPNILDSLTKNQMNLNPQQDGSTIYVPIPKVTKEYRETLSKNAKSFYVKSCDNIKEIRNKHVKVVKQKENLAKDLAFRVETYIDILSHQYISKAEEILDVKQKELLGE